MRVILAMGLLLWALAGPARAQEDMQSEAQAWQAVVTGQIEAFRAGDGAAALELAADGFKQQYSDPERFYADILASGYEPIVASRSHSFGDFRRVGDTVVLQVVRLVGPDQGLYEALYQLGSEPDGWRVQGVRLRQEEGMGV